MPHIVVIEDDVTAQALTEKMLESEGFTVTTALDGRRALRAIGATAPDLVITDILMPEMEGVETITRLRARFPELPIVAISGGWSYEGVDLLKLVRRLGATESLSKPFRRAELLSVVRKCLAAAPHADRPN